MKNWRYLLLAMSMALSACQSDGSVIADNGTIANLNYEKVAFQRFGGTRCPDKADTTPDNAHCASVTMSYPKVTSTDNPQVAETINCFIQEQLIEYSDENEKQPKSLDELATMFIHDFQADPDTTGTWELERSVEVVYGTAQFITLLLSENGYTGGAHPFSGQRFFVLDTRTGKQLTLANLLNANYAEKLNPLGEKYFRAARELAPNANLTDEGFWFENNQFKLNTNFGVTAKGLAFIFNPYEVAPYALGSTELLIPYTDVRELIPDNSPLASVLKP